MEARSSIIPSGGMVTSFQYLNISIPSERHSLAIESIWLEHLSGARTVPCCSILFTVKTSESPTGVLTKMSTSLFISLIRENLSFINWISISISTWPAWRTSTSFWYLAELNDRKDCWVILSQGWAVQQQGKYDENYCFHSGGKLDTACILAGLQQYFHKHLKDRQAKLSNHKSCNLNSIFVVYVMIIQQLVSESKCL